MTRRCKCCTIRTITSALKCFRYTFYESLPFLPLITAMVGGLQFRKMRSGVDCNDLNMMKHLEPVNIVLVMFPYKDISTEIHNYIQKQAVSKDVSVILCAAAFS